MEDKVKEALDYLFELETDVENLNKDITLVKEALNNLKEEKITQEAFEELLDGKLDTYKHIVLFE